MPRHLRIDSPGALRNIIVRSIERRKIFNDDIGRINFLDLLLHISRILAGKFVVKQIDPS